MTEGNHRDNARLMGDLDPFSEQDIEQVSAAWLASQATEEPPDGWVERWQTRRCVDGDYMVMWRFVLKLCQEVAADDSDTIGMIAADPLWCVIDNWPDRALTSIEAEVETNPRLLRVCPRTRWWAGVVTT